MSSTDFDSLAREVSARFLAGPRLAVLGSTDFWHMDSERTCTEIGRILAEIPDLVLLTGGVEGIGEAIGRSYFQSVASAGRQPCVYHILPEGEVAWDYGETFFAGADMTERREVLGRLAGVYLMVEGGPRAGHEAQVASARGATIIPVGRSGGFAATLYAQMDRRGGIDADTWTALGCDRASPEETARSVVGAVRACLDLPSRD